MRLGPLTEMDERRLGGIVHGLTTWNVDNMARHARRRNEAAAFKPLQFLPRRRRPLQFLSAEVLAGRMSTVRHAIRVNLHQLMVSLDVRVQKRLVAPRNTRIGHENIQAAVELGNHRLYRLFHVVIRSDVDLVRLAYMPCQTCPVRAKWEQWG